MDKLNSALDFIIRIIAVIIGLCTLLVIGILILSYLTFSDLGSNSDQEIISSIPPKFGIQKILAKDSDVIDGSCTAIIMEISEVASRQIREDGISFFTLETTIRTDNKEWKPLSLLKAEPEIINNEGFLNAVRCSKISDEYKILAEKLIKSEQGYYAVSFRHRTIYSVFPNDRKLFITHID